VVLDAVEKLVTSGTNRRASLMWPRRISPASFSPACPIASLTLRGSREKAEEAQAKAVHADGPTPEEAVESLRELPELWADAEPSGRKLLAESLFDRIDVLGSRKVKLHPSASAKAPGWDRAWNGARLVVMVGARGLGPP